MNSFIQDPLFGMFITLFFFCFFRYICNKFNIKTLNPLILSIITIILLLKIFNLNYDDYLKGAKLFNILIVPATVALAIPLYKNFSILKKYYKEILISIGVSTFILTFLVGILVSVLKIDQSLLASILPKSVTTAIAVGVSEQIQGIEAITVIIVIISGNIGALFAEPIFKLFKIKHPIAQGISLGTTSHAVGTTKALELEKFKVSMSGLAIIITGIFVVIMVLLYITC